MSKQNLFNNFFNSLNQKNINYCIINGYENYPDIIDSDIDIIVESFDLFENILQILSKEVKFKIIQKLEHKHKVANFFISKEYNGVVEILSLDIYEHYIVKERLFFDNQYFLIDKKKFKNFFIPNNEKEFLYYFIKKVIKQDIEININKLFDKYEKNILFDKFFKNNHQNIKIAFENKDKTFFIMNKKLLKKELFETVKIHKYFVAMELIRIIRRTINPTGFTVSFLGSDGSGKSTIIKELKKRELPFRRIDYFHLKPRFLGNKGDGKPVTNPHAKKPYYGVLSYLKLLYFMHDYIVGYFIKILPLKVKSSLIIFDRYYDDILVDPKRFRYGGSLWFAKIMRYFIPKPTIYFILIAEPDIIYQRKQEVSFHELKRQIDVYKTLVDNKQYIKINVNRDVNKIVDEIEKIIYGKLNERY